MTINSVSDTTALNNITADFNQTNIVEQKEEVKMEFEVVNQVVWMKRDYIGEKINMIA